MKIENPIGWCDATTNAVTGCAKVSPGCANCYAEAGTRARVLRAADRETWGPRAERAPVDFEPVFRRLNRRCVCDLCHEAHPFEVVCGECTTVTNMSQFTQSDQRCHGMLRRVRLFADSNSDWLDPAWPAATLAQFLNAVRLAPNVDVLLLTKRPELFRERLAAALDALVKDQEGEFFESDDEWALAGWLDNWLDGKPPGHVWLGVSAEDQRRADDRIPLLLKMPAAVRFVSAEPLLEEIDLNRAGATVTDAEGAIGDPDPSLTRSFERGQVDWVIVGGESGPRRRDCGVAAIAYTAEQCRAAGVPVYVKQDCHRLPGQQGRIPDGWWRMKEFPI